MGMEEVGYCQRPSRLSERAMAKGERMRGSAGSYVPWTVTAG